MTTVRTRRKSVPDTTTQAFENIEAIVTAKHSSSTSTDPSCTSTVLPGTSNRVPRPNITWKSKHLNLNTEQLHFHGSDNLSPEILCLATPFQVFSYLLTDDIINLRDQTNLYSVQRDASKPVNVSSQEIRQFIGIVYYMSIENNG